MNPFSSPGQLFWRHPDLPFAESRQAWNVASCYLPHSHTRYAIGSVEQGRTRFACRGQTRLLGAGEVVLIPAGEVHACNPDPGLAWAYQILYLDEPWLEEVIGESAGLDAVRLPVATSGAHPHLYAALNRLNSRLFDGASADECEAELIRFACEALGPSRLAEETPRPLTPGKLAEVKALIQVRCAESLPLALLASTAGLSPYHFVRSFQRSVGMTPHAWQLDARIDRARRLIDAGQPFSQIAQELGFADQSHFHRAFKQRVAATPGQYRRNIVQ